LKPWPDGQLAGRISDEESQDIGDDRKGTLVGKKGEGRKLGISDSRISGREIRRDFDVTVVERPNFRVHLRMVAEPPLWPTTDQEKKKKNREGEARGRAICKP